MPRKSASYLLESNDEFKRLERQAAQSAYDYKEEISHLRLSGSDVVLDAGCGSGVLSRFLAERSPDTVIHACDFSQKRIEQAKAAGEYFKNLQFSQADLTALSYDSNKFTHIFCRYVLEHLNVEQVSLALNELYRCLKPGGVIHAIDFDGPFHNLFPQTKIVRQGLQAFAKSPGVDLYVGRKIPYYLGKAGLSAVQWHIHTVSFQDKELEAEIEMIESRFNQTEMFWIKLLGSKKKWQAFRKEYIECLRAPNATLFYNKFIVTATKPSRPTLALIKGR